MTAPIPEALKLQRPLPDGTLRIVARGVTGDDAYQPFNDRALREGSERTRQEPRNR